MKPLTFLLACLLLIAFTSEICAQQPDTKVYWMAIVTIPVGKIQDYHAFAAKELVPFYEKHGYRFIGGWQTIVGEIEEAISIAEFDNMDAYLKARMSLMASPEWKTIGSKTDMYAKAVRTRMLSAVPYLKTK